MLYLRNPPSKSPRVCVRASVYFVFIWMYEHNLVIVSYPTWFAYADHHQTLKSVNFSLMSSKFLAAFMHGDSFRAHHLSTLFSGSSSWKRLPNFHQIQLRTSRHRLVLNLALPAFIKKMRSGAICGRRQTDKRFGFLLNRGAERYNSIPHHIMAHWAQRIMLTLLKG